MGKKYIIEIPEDKIVDFVGSTHFLMPYMMAGHIGHHDTGLPIKPYTEPDLERVKKTAHDDGHSEGYQAGREDLNLVLSDFERVRKEAYEQGQKDLRESCVPKDEEAYGIGYNEGYAQGLADVWDAAREIENLSEAEKFEIFGEYDMFHIMRRYTATEAIEKIRQYEQAQKEEEKPIRAEDVMRQYLDEFCKRRWCCAECVLRTDDFTCGRGYSFTGITPVSDEEVRRAYAEVMKK